ncbi:MAG: hypothetical protein JW908_11140 [Anaerolineales bacterium]|nr:hypothetical protein [Anaerolineales bacterium]
MSKKSKKQVRKGNAPTQQSEQATPSATVSAAPVSLGRVSDREFNPDYSPVIKDLKRIGSLAGVFIFILVVLSFFLR